MTKLEKIVHLINILHHRRYVTLEKIQEICDISQRTAFRYLNSISRANIPIYYDKTIHGYRIDPRDSYGIEDLRPSDAVLLLVALHVLSQKLDSEYVEDVERLKRRVLSRLTFPLEEVWDSFGTHSEGVFQSENISSLVTSLLVHTSVINNKKLALVLADADQHTRGVEIVNPSLTFKQEWRLKDSLSDDQEAIPVSKIRKATIV
jgi:hypothetical protein